MKFRTEIDIAKAAKQIDYSNRILAIGSCFALSIGGKLRESKFRAEVNPAGVLFNPLSICRALSRFADCRKVSVEELEQNREGWFHFDFHGSLSGATAIEAIQNINEAVEIGATALRESDTIIITLGTAWVYELVESGAVVANCHKEPAKRFVRRLISVEEIVEALSVVVDLYPKKNFIFSLSPVRHLLDGLAENSLSKALLRVAIEKVVCRYANVSYFPAYEILIDDLRDYRFYADDMLHPAPQAVVYIWEKFSEAYISAQALKTMVDVEKIMSAAAHRPFNASSEAYQSFCRKQLGLIRNYPMIDFDKENGYFMGQLQNNL